MPREVIDFAALLLPVAAPGVVAPTSIRSIAGALQVRAVRALAAGVVEAVASRWFSQGSIGVIVAESVVPGVSAALAAAGIDA